MPDKPTAAIFGNQQKENDTKNIDWFPKKCSPIRKRKKTASTNQLVTQDSSKQIKKRKRILVSQRIMVNHKKIGIEKGKRRRNKRTIPISETIFFDERGKTREEPAESPIFGTGTLSSWDSADSWSFHGRFKPTNHEEKGFYWQWA